MKLIKAKYEILESQGFLKDIEIAARTCYKSEDRITEDSAEKMVKSLILRGHGAMLEHGTVYLEINNAQSGHFHTLKDKYLRNKYSKTIVKDYPNDLSNRGIVFCEAFITTNYRVLVENKWLDDLQYQCEPTKFHEKRVSVRFICDRGVSHKKFVA